MKKIILTILLALAAFAGGFALCGVTDLRVLPKPGGLEPAATPSPTVAPATETATPSPTVTLPPTVTPTETATVTQTAPAYVPDLRLDMWRSPDGTIYVTLVDIGPNPDSRFPPIAIEGENCGVSGDGITFVPFIGECRVIFDFTLP